MSSEEREHQWTTDAPEHYTVGEAERDELDGIPWPISGDETTICHNEGAAK